MKKPSLLNLVFSLFGACIVLFLLAPLLKMLLSSPAGELHDALIDGEVRRAIALSLTCAFWATLMGTVFGVPLRHYLGGQFFSRFGLTFVGDVPGIVIAMLFVSSSFLINAARDGFRTVDPRLEYVARTLGYGPLGAFFSVAVPLSWRNLLSGAIMMWARAISEFGAILILTYNPKVASVLIYDRFTTYGLKYALPPALALVLLSLSVFALLRGISLQRGQGRTA